MFSRGFQGVARARYFGPRFFHNARNVQQNLTKYQFNNGLFWNSRGLPKPASNLEQTKMGRIIRQEEINEKMKAGPFGTFDHILQKRDEPLGQGQFDMEKVKACFNWFWNNPELHVRGNVHYYEFRETPGFFTKVDIWKGKKIQVLIHIFENNEPQIGVIHNHNHGFFFQNISLQNNAEYKTSQYKIDEHGKNVIYGWKREASTGKLTPVGPIKATLIKTYEHNYKNGIIGFTEQDTLHQVSAAKGKVISFIVRESNYHGEQMIYSTESSLPEDQDFKVRKPELKKKEKFMCLLRKVAKIFISIKKTILINIRNSV